MSRGIYRPDQIQEMKVLGLEKLTDYLFGSLILGSAPYASHVDPEFKITTEGDNTR